MVLGRICKYVPTDENIHIWFYEPAICRSYTKREKGFLDDVGRQNIHSHVIIALQWQYRRISTFPSTKAIEVENGFL